MKKIITSILTTCLIASNIAVVSAKSYTDIKSSDWYYAYVNTLTSKGGINGYEDNTFRPQNTITNAEFIKIVVGSAIGEQAQGTEHWSDNYTKKAKEVGLVEDGEWENLDEPINRQSMAKIVARTLTKVFGETDISDTSSYTNAITDWDNTCEPCKPFIAQALAKGIITGYEDGTFGGTRTATRAEASAMLVRLIDRDYRSEWVSGIPFSNKTDTNKYGMNLTKSQLFAEKFLKTFKIYEDNGRVKITGNFPTLPQGYYWNFQITMLDKDYKYIGDSVIGTNAKNLSMIRPETTIPHLGEFYHEFGFGKGQVEEVLIRISIINEKTGKSNSGVKIARTYSKDINNTYENFYSYGDLVNGDGGGAVHSLMEFDYIWNVFGW